MHFDGLQPHNSRCYGASGFINKDRAASDVQRNSFSSKFSLMANSVVSKKPEIKIQLLQSAPRCFAQVAAWHHQECARQGLQSSFAIRQQRLLAHVREDSIPKTLVVFLEGQVIGCVSLVNYTYRPENSPLPQKAIAPLWLSNLFVVEEKRRKGFGNLLIEAAKKYAREMGVSELWLSAAEYTDYYQKRGWAIARHTRLGGRQVNVMKIYLDCEVPLQMIS